MKKSLLGLLCVSACCLAGCGKSISTEEACKMADENWVTGEAAVKKDVEVKTVAKIKKATGVFEDVKQDDVEKTVKETVYAASSEEVAALGLEGYKFSTFAGKLYAECEISIKDMYEFLKLVPSEYIKGEAKSSYVFNKEGFLISVEDKIDVSVEYKAGGVSIEGKLSGYTEVTYNI